MFGDHVQNPLPGWTRHLATLPAGTPIKAVDNVQLLGEVKQINPQLKTVLRHWYDHGQVFDNSPYSVLLDRAAAFFASFIDGTFAQYAATVDYVETYNETLANSQTPEEKQWRINQERAMCEVWARDYKARFPHIKLVLANAAIGNDIPWEYADLAVSYGHVLGYHAYIGVHKGAISPADAIWLSGRWKQMDAAYRQKVSPTHPNGIHVHWLITEAGPCWDRTGTGSLDPNAGWKNGEVCGGSLEKYRQFLGVFMNSAATWNKSNGNRFLGGVLFTSGTDDVWEEFNLTADHWDNLAAFIKDFKPGDPPPPPPPPVPSSALKNGSFENGWDTLPPLPNSLKNQRPNDWQLETKNPGDTCWDFRNQKLNAPLVADGWPECVHKLAYPNGLPEDESPGGADPLILDGTHVYKIFSMADKFAAALRQEFTATGTLRLRIRTHYHGPVNADSPDTAQVKILVNGVERKHLKALPDLPNKKWVQIDIPVNGVTKLEVRFASIWKMGIDFFMDKWEVIAGSPPPTSPQVETRVQLLRPRFMSDAQWLKIRNLMEAGIDAALIGRSDAQTIVIGYEGWSHVDAYLSIKQSIDAGKLDSRLVVMDGDQIGTGLDRAWVLSNWPDIAEYVYFVTSAAATIVTPLVASHWPTPHRKVTQQFGANPQNYPQTGLYGHDGTDIRAYHGDPVYCVAAGVVHSIYTSATGHNYGKHVRVNHTQGRFTHQTIYAHLDSIAVTPGQTVAGGQELGKADNTGNSFGDHLHLTYKVPGYNYTDEKGNVWGYNIFDSTAALKPLAPELFP